MIGVNSYNVLFRVSIFVIVIMSYTTTSFHWDNNLVEKGTLNILQSLINCTNKKITSRTYKHRNFIVLENYITNATKVECHEAVTYSTHGGFEYLDNLLFLVKRWMDPISVAVYAPGEDFERALTSIQYLRQCSDQRQFISTLVSFHVFFLKNHTPSYIPKNNVLQTTVINCGQTRSYLKQLRLSSETFRTTNDILYPVNVARNIARDASTTHYLLASDIELYPSPNLVPQFLNMVALNQKPLSTSTHPRIFPISVFEVTADVHVPNSKKQLQDMLKSGKAIPFHRSLCPRCHSMPLASQWIKASETAEIKVFHVAKRNGRYMRWEPFFIGTNDDPYYDERLSWEGMSDKMTQGYILCVKNYDFMTLTNAFLVHRPGIKNQNRDQKRNQIIAAQNNYIRSTIFPNLKRIFGTRPGCVI